MRANLLTKHGLELGETRLPDVWSVRLAQNTDYRGSYMTFCHNKLFHEMTGERIAEGNLVENYAGTFRGYHYSPRSWKFYLCLRGALHYYLVNWDKSHSGYGEWQQITLLPYHGFFKHPRYATGMWSIGDSTLLVLQSQYYDAKNPDQVTIAIDILNAELAKIGKKTIYYPDLPLILSERDALGEYV